MNLKDLQTLKLKTFKMKRIDYGQEEKNDKQNLSHIALM